MLTMAVIITMSAWNFSEERYDGAPTAYQFVRDCRNGFEESFGQDSEAVWFGDGVTKNKQSYCAWRDDKGILNIAFLGSVEEPLLGQLAKADREEAKKPKKGECVSQPIWQIYYISDGHGHVWIESDKTAFTWAKLGKVGKSPKAYKEKLKKAGIEL